MMQKNSSLTHLIIRPARIEDAPGIYEAHKFAIQQICAKDYTPEQIDGWFPSSRTPEDYAVKIAAKSCGYLVAEIDGKIAGFSTFENEEMSSSIFTLTIPALAQAKLYLPPLKRK
ncbi:MAG: GCN5-related N-acetyltransferase [Alphaproteobacteria bacterium]|nr:GCN5-related N-acetyltransferase [Alphaproteobacteria bacterium]